MLKTKPNYKKKTGRTTEVAIAGLIALGMLLNSGCGQSETPAASAVASSESAASVVVPEESPALRDVYPALADGALQLARLTDLPDGLLLQAEGVSITKGDIQDELSQVPAETRDEMRKNAFFLLEQKAVMELLTLKAQQQFGDVSLPQEQLLQNYFDDLTSTIDVTDAEIETFYEENRNLVGNAPLEQVKPQIQSHLHQQKQQEAVDNHIAELGSAMTIALDADWVKEQAALAMDNPVDKARASGIPTFVNFGSKGCGPCDMMEPIRKEIRAEHGERLNVVYVPVNEERMLASRYGIRGIPHLVFFDKDGKEVHTHTGFMPKEQIEEWVKKSGASKI